MTETNNRWNRAGQVLLAAAVVVVAIAVVPLLDRDSAPAPGEGEHEPRALSLVPVPDTRPAFRPVPAPIARGERPQLARPAVMEIENERGETVRLIRPAEMERRSRVVDEWNRENLASYRLYVHLQELERYLDDLDSSGWPVSPTIREEAETLVQRDVTLGAGDCASEWDSLGYASADECGRMRLVDQHAVCEEFQELLVRERCEGCDPYGAFNRMQDFQRIFSCYSWGRATANSEIDALLAHQRQFAQGAPMTASVTP